MIEEFEVLHPGNLFPWKLCEERFAELHPEIFIKYLTGKQSDNETDNFDYIQELLEEHGVYESSCGLYSALWEISHELPSIYLHLSSGDRQVISNLSIVKLNFSNQIDSDCLISTDRFFIIIIDKCSSQFGTLGIWDTASNNWCFSQTEEHFCVNKIDYYPLENEFRGKFEYSVSHNPIWGKGNFVIDKHRVFRTMDYSYTTWNDSRTGTTPVIKGIGPFFDFEK